MAHRTRYWRRHRVAGIPTHPTTCQCDGTGWIPGPPIPSSHHGQPFNYTTVTPCPGPIRENSAQLQLAERHDFF